MKALVLTVVLLGGVVCAKAVNVGDLWQKTPPKKSTTPLKNLWHKSAPKPASKPTSKGTASQIHDSKDTLQHTTSQQQMMSQQLTKIAQTIKRTELESIAISKVIDRLEKDQKKSEVKYQTAKTAIDEFGGKIRKLDTTIQTRHGAFIHLLTDQFALIAAMGAIDRPTINSVIQHEAYEAYKKKNNHELATLKKEIDGSRDAKARLQARQKTIQKSIATIMAKRELYRKKKKEKETLLSSLSHKEEEYRTRLKTIMKRQEMLRQTLAKLNILRKEEIARAQRAEKARRVELRAKTAELKRLRQAQASRVKAAKAEGRDVTYAAPQIAAPTTPTGQVKQYGSSYQANNIQRYRGAKTISPLAHARVIKKFGSYIDPIYKIKIFNDNIVLKATKRNAKVRNVLNGKVVYVGQNSMLGKVVIVEHGHRIHTIYASLDRISPMLRTGSRVKKGVIIGRIKRKLIFQATQNSKYINPLRLIRL